MKTKLQKLLSLLLTACLTAALLPTAVQAAGPPADWGPHTPHNLSASLMEVDETHPYGSALLRFEIGDLPRDDDTDRWRVAFEKKIGDGVWISVGDPPSSDFLDDYQVEPGVFEYEQIWNESYEWDPGTSVSFRVRVTLYDNGFSFVGTSDYSNLAGIGPDFEEEFVCEIVETGVQYMSLDDALDEVEDGQTILLLTGIDYAGGLVIADMDITFNLNGHTLEVNNDEGIGLLVQYCDVEIRGAGAFNVTGTSGVRAESGSAQVTFATGTAGAGVCAEGTDTFIHVTGDVEGDTYGVCAGGSNCRVTVDGDIDALDGVYVYHGGTAIIEGEIAASGTYILAGTESLSQSDSQLDPDMPGYLYYTDDGTNRAWVRGEPAPAYVCEIVETDTQYASLGEALSEVLENQTIRLLTGIDHNQGILVDGKTLTFDVDGWTLNVVQGPIQAGFEGDSFGLMVVNGGVVELIDEPGTGAFHVAGDEYGLYLSDDSQATVTSATATGYGYGVYAVNGTRATVLGSVEATGHPSSVGVRAESDSTVTVGGDVSGHFAGATASFNSRIDIGGHVTFEQGELDTDRHGVGVWDGSYITVGQNISSDSSEGPGAWIYYDNEGDPAPCIVTVEGEILTPGRYIRIFEDELEIGDNTVPTEEEGYRTYLSTDYGYLGYVLVKSTTFPDPDEDDPPTVVTNAVSGVTASGASLSGIVTSDGGATVTERGFVYGTSDNPTTSSGTKVTVGTGTGSFTTNLSDLAANNTYHVRAYAVNSEGTSYGANISFTTLPASTPTDPPDDDDPPTVITNSVTGITESTALLSGNATSDGGAAVTERGFVYGTNSNLTIVTDKKITAGNGTGGFTATLTGLMADTTYYVRAYAINSEGTSYGAVVTFRTNEDELGNIPKTGDSGFGLVWWMLLAVSGAGVVVVAAAGKKRFHKR